MSRLGIELKVRAWRAQVDRPLESGLGMPLDVNEQT